MASTYSPSLRIELIGPGEQAGTWNTTTNTNLGTLIESAIAGYVSVSVTSADQALTALDGTADEARNAVIALTTTTTANFAIYAPPQEKQYIIWNTTAYTATIYNSTVLGNTTAAGTGVAIPAGKKFSVFTTGADFSSVDPAGVLSTAQPNGTLLIGNGSGFSASTLTAGANISITNGAGTITIAGTGATGASIPAGTVMLFVQSSAPTGWTKSFSHNNKALRVVTGGVSSGGSVGFTSAFVNQGVSGSVSGTVYGATLSTAQMPQHTHGPAAGTGFITFQSGGSLNALVAGPDTYYQGSTTQITGGGGSHDHFFTAGFSGNPINLDVQYVDVIIATAN